MIDAELLFSELSSRRAAVAVVGLGYVGLPLAVCLSRVFRVIGVDINAAKIAKLNAGQDPIGEVGDDALRTALDAQGITFTTDAARLREARFIIVCVPTPVDRAKRPDLSLLLSASRTVGAQLCAGSVVVFESTVFPGATEELCVPELERTSGLQTGVEFGIGYSPERINPGDREHRIDTVVKVVSGGDAVTLAVLARVYGAAIPAGVFRAASIRVAEAAKVIENTQRDLNIALMNELALIFHRLGINTADVLATARSKWNFLPFTPGLVGGHCIGVDPYYLTHKAQEAGHHPEVILAGRRINDAMGAWIAQECVRLVAASARRVHGATVVVLGVSFKEDCADVRNSRVFDIISELERYGIRVLVVDPVADIGGSEHVPAIALTPWSSTLRADALISAVAHRAFRALTAADLAMLLGAGGPVLDVKGAHRDLDLTSVNLVRWEL